MIGIRIIFCLFLLALSSACERPDSADPVDVLTQSPPSKDRIPVTVLVKNAFSINAFDVYRWKYRFSKRLSYMKVVVV